ncbi:hypothetical protein DH2020_039094 [Rehmannia glutinosa]|uniref:Cytochrome c oxidase subunit 5C n=1 Tax=Rehmannia glutinosa TaxID=99300 RepID=A0ABR0UYM5_REHGL
MNLESELSAVFWESSRWGTHRGPSVVKEILTAVALGIAAGSVWKMHQWNEQRKVRAFYDLLDKGEITVVAAEE